MSDEKNIKEPIERSNEPKEQQLDAISPLKQEEVEVEEE
jgi:hypothetical protein